MNFGEYKKCVMFFLAPILMAVPTHAKSHQPPTLSHQGEITWKLSKDYSSCRTSTMLDSNTKGNAHGIEVIRTSRLGTFNVFFVSSSIDKKILRKMVHKRKLRLVLKSHEGELTSKERLFSMIWLNEQSVPGIGGVFDMDDLSFFKSNPVVDAFVDGRFVARLQGLEIRGAVESLENCYASLLNEWALDPAELAKISKFAEPEEEPWRWVDPVDFAFLTEWRTVDSRVLLKFAIDAEGRIGECEVLVGGNLQYMPRTVCKRFQRRGRYTPAEDVDGNKIPSHEIISVRLATNPGIPGFGE